MSERRKFAPYGLNGGRPGLPGKNVLISGGKELVLKSKVNLSVKPGDVLRIESPGGEDMAGVGKLWPPRRLRADETETGTRCPPAQYSALSRGFS